MLSNSVENFDNRSQENETKPTAQHYFKVNPQTVPKKRAITASRQSQRPSSTSSRLRKFIETKHCYGALVDDS